MRTLAFYATKKRLIVNKYRQIIGMLKKLFCMDFISNECIEAKFSFFFIDAFYTFLQIAF